MADAHVPLSYAPPPSPLRRRRVRRAAWLALFIGVALVGLRWGPWAWGRARLLYWQRQCLRYAAPADQIVYEQDPARAAALLAGGGGYVPLTLPGVRRAGGAGATAAGILPRAATNLRALGPPPMKRMLVAGGPSAPGAVLFLHERRTPGGARCLVCVSSRFAADRDPLFINGFDLDATVLQPGTWRAGPEDRSGTIALSVMFATRPILVRLRIFAGQPDAADASHFTIRYELDGKPGTVDGWMRDQGRGYVHLQFRKRPGSP